MRRISLLMAAGLLLVGAGVAVAHGFDSNALKQVGATSFTATTASDLRSSTCTGATGSYTKSRGTYTGSVTSTEAALNGPAKIDASSLVNTTTGVGIVSGEVRIDTANGGRTSAHFEGVLTHGSVVGLAEGGTRSGHEGDKVALLGNFSADYSAAGGFSNGKLGGTASGDAVLISRGGCSAPKPSRPEHIKARGAITAASPTLITVAGVTCNVPASLQGAVAKVKVNDVVEIECDVANATNTLTKLSGREGDDRR